MDGQQFAQFITAEQGDRAAARQEAATRYVHQRDLAEKSASYARADSLIKRVPGCDGATIRGVREWFKELEYTIPHCPLTVYI